VTLLAGLIVFSRFPDLIRHSSGLSALATRHPMIHRLEQVSTAMRNGELNPQDVDALAAGYYEGLQKDAGPAGLPAERDDVRFRDNFLRYELKPNVKRPYDAGMRITNSLGMANPEYPYDKAPRTRRIALLGDSMSLGPYGRDYGALLEDRLNQAYHSPEVSKFEVLNFAVYGYSIIQMMDVALDKAPLFHPDVYIVAVTHLELIPNAGSRTHIGRLLGSGTDLKYAFLRDVVARAGVRPADHLPVIRNKLAPYLFPVARWALEQIRDRAASQGARMVIVLMAAPIDPKLTASDFDRLHKATDGLGVPVIDLRDTFQSVNLLDMQVDPRADIHPNAKGHRLMFENLLAKLQAQPQAWAAVIGTEPEAAHHPDHAPTDRHY